MEEKDDLRKFFEEINKKFQVADSAELNNLFDRAKLRSSNKELEDKFNSAKLSDLNWSKWLRLVLSLFFCFILWRQNYWIFQLIDKAFDLKVISQLQWFLGILLSATLTETYFIFRLIVKWVFKDRPYKSDHIN